MTLPEIHTYLNGPLVKRVFWRDTDGREIDLTGCRVVGIERTIRMGDLPHVEVSFTAVLVENQSPAKVDA